MTSNVLLTLIVSVTVLLIFGLSTLLVKVRYNRAMIRALVKAQEKISQKQAQNTQDLMALFKQFYQDRAQIYVDGLIKQYCIFFEQLLTLLLDCKPQSLELLPSFIDGLTVAYATSLHEAAAQLASLQQKPVMEEVNIIEDAKGISQETEQYLKEAMDAMSKLAGEQEILAEEELSFPDMLNKFLIDLKDKTAAQIQQKQESVTGELNHYSDLIDQLRQEKKDMKSKNAELQKILELIYAKYREQLDWPPDVAFKHSKYQNLLETFKLEDQ